MLVPLLLTVLLSVAGQILVRQAVLEVGASPLTIGELPALLWRAFSDLRVILGLACALLAAAASVTALARGGLSSAHPFMGLAIVLVLALSGIVFGERVSLTRWLGAITVCAGVWLASR
jgi:drug/metabolite transporter (DMT)-like permease